MKEPVIHFQYRERVQKIAQHEMGHYVASRRLGFRTGDVTVQVHGLTLGHKGEAVIELNKPILSVADLDEYLCRRIMILYAGALAETLFIGSPAKRIGEDEQGEAVRILDDPQSGAYVDHAKIRELRALLRNIRFPETDPADNEKLLEELKALNDELWDRTIALVEEHYELICGLAANLTQRLVKAGDQIMISSEELEALPAIQALKPI